MIHDLILRRAGVALSFLLASACGDGSNQGDDELGDTSSDTDSSSADSSESDSTESDSTESDSTESDPTDETSGGEFTLTSPAFVEGGAIPIEHSCYGANVSPQLDWVDAPAEAQSFAVFFEDLTINFNHSAIWNIPVALDGLPADVDKSPMPADVPGASQGPSYAGNNGYAGPCPGQPHTYQFTVHALDVATLDELSTASTLAQVEAALQAHSLGQATLSGEFTPP